MKILHIISGLNSGGAEGVMYRLINKDNSNNHYVISLTNEGFYGQKLIKKKISLYCLYSKKNLSFFFSFFKLIIQIKKINPDIVQCWMYHGDFFGGLAAKFLGKKKIFWNLRNSDLSLDWSNKSTIFLAKLSSIFSYFIPSKIISCSHQSTKAHLELGYCKRKIVLIDNGFDLSKFSYSKKYRDYWRSVLKIKKKEIVFGFVGRWSLQKDFKTLFIAFKNFLTSKKNSKKIKLLLIGKDINSKNNDLNRELLKYNLKKNILLMNETDKINKILSVIDIGVFVSRGNEGFPNVIAEKMATRIPCIVSNVGDAARIVGINGPVYKKNNWIDLNKKIVFIYNQYVSNKMIWESKKFFSRNRIKQNFSLKKMVNSYKNIWNY
ncbi:glycosyltransferase [Candidatus Pelagibacter sp.]|nr:glycosyltransferase [Candidatus Pelagibacter sp.]